MCLYRVSVGLSALAVTLVAAQRSYCVDQYHIVSQVIFGEVMMTRNGAINRQRHQSEGSSTSPGSASSKASQKAAGKRLSLVAKDGTTSGTERNLLADGDTTRVNEQVTVHNLTAVIEKVFLHLLQKPKVISALCESIMSEVTDVMKTELRESESKISLRVETINKMNEDLTKYQQETKAESSAIQKNVM